MPFDSRQSDVDRQVEASMRMFEQAHVGPPAPVAPIHPERVLVCLDGSGQDDGVIAAAAFFNARTSPCQLLVLDAREQDEPGSYADERAAALREARVVRVETGDAYDRILAAVETETPDLVIVPCPFGRDFESVGADSTGTVIDVLLSRCAVPMLVIRRGDQPLEIATGDLALVVSGESESAPTVVGWAVGMAAEGATLTLNLVVEPARLETLRELLEQLAPDQPIDRERLEGAMTKTHARLHAAAAKAAAAAGLRYRLDPDAAESAEPDLQEVARPRLIVLPLERSERHSYGFVQDRIRRSPHPLLVIPSRTPGRDQALSEN